MRKAKVAILISGKGSNMAALLYASRAADCPYEVVLVASDKPSAPGLALAKGEGVRTFALSAKELSREEHDRGIEAAIQQAGADFVALAGYMRILSAEFVARWGGRMLNIHPSLLPAYKGLNTHARAIAAGDSHGGCSVHLVTAELDDGEVLAQTPVAILPQDTPATLAERVLIAEHQLYPRTLAEWVSREMDGEWIKARVASIALALPETHERTSHGSPGWRVGSEKSGKFFAILFNAHHGEDAIGVLVKTGSMDELLNLCEQQEDVYFKPAYYGASGWIGIRLNRPNVDWQHVADWLNRSWRLSAPPRLTRLQEAAEAF
jgi:phosphoribosylglycinamide formyltransferase-1